MSFVVDTHYLIWSLISPEQIPADHVEILEATASGFTVLGVTTEQFAGSHRLEYIGRHRDPFDRLLIWQCITSELRLLTADADIRQYASVGLRLG